MRDDPDLGTLQKWVDIGFWPVLGHGPDTGLPQNWPETENVPYR